MALFPWTVRILNVALLTFEPMCLKDTDEIRQHSAQTERAAAAADWPLLSLLTLFTGIYSLTVTAWSVSSTRSGSNSFKMRNEVRDNARAVVWQNVTAADHCRSLTAASVEVWDFSPFFFYQRQLTLLCSREWNDHSVQYILNVFS